MLNYLTIHNLRLAYWSDERGPDPLRRNLLFVHGSGGDHGIWTCQLAELRNRFNLWAIDLPGHGRSTGEGETEVGEYALWVKRLIEGLKLNQPVVIGHSLGAAICLTLTCKYPEIIAGAVLIGGGAELPVNPMILDGLKNDPKATLSLVVKISLAKANRERLAWVVADQMTRSETDVLYKDLLACSLFNLKGELAGIKVATLVICGAEDKMTPPALSNHLQGHIPGATLTLIEGAGHFVMQEQPAAVNDALIRFVDLLPTSA